MTAFLAFLLATAFGATPLGAGAALVSPLPPAMYIGCDAIPPTSRQCWIDIGPNQQLILTQAQSGIHAQIEERRTKP